MNTTKEDSHLTRLGNLLVDLSEVRAVLPLQGERPEQSHGFDIVTSGGVLQVYDNETAEAVREHFYQS